MNPPLKSGDDAVKAFERAGFEKAHRKGSHQVLTKQVNDRTVVTVVVAGK